MTTPQHSGAVATVVTALSEALAAGTPEAFAALLTADVHWGGEHGDNQCTTQAEAGDHYALLLAAGATWQVTEAREDVPQGALGAHGVDTRAQNGGMVLLVRLGTRSPESDDFTQELTVRLTLRDGLIADICELDPPPTIELLFFDGCPHYDTFQPHLQHLLDDLGIATPITLIDVRNDDEARTLRFLGSPTLRVNGHDVDTSAPSGDTDDDYAMRCRIYYTPAGATGTPPDQWILDALFENSLHEAAVSQSD